MADEEQEELIAYDEQSDVEDNVTAEKPAASDGKEVVKK